MKVIALRPEKGREAANKARAGNEPNQGRHGRGKSRRGIPPFRALTWRAGWLSLPLVPRFRALWATYTSFAPKISIRATVKSILGNSRVDLDGPFS
jgi:hypothetical protein